MSLVVERRVLGSKVVVVQLLSHVPLFVTPLTVARQTPLSMEFSRQEYWSGLPLPTPGNLPDLEMKPESLCLLHWQANCLPECH